VKGYSHVRGIDKDVFFFDHQEREQTDEGLLSKMNMFEAEIIVRFTDYLWK